jgi:DNA-binding MarR family transcriptional regulator
MGYGKTRLIAILDRLADEGLIERTPDPEDRRARIVQLTAAGRARHRQDWVTARVSRVSRPRPRTAT